MVSFFILFMLYIYIYVVCRLKIIFRKLLLYYSGFHIGGFGLGESMDERPALLSAVIVWIMLLQCKLLSTFDFCLLEVLFK